MRVGSKFDTGLQYLYKGDKFLTINRDAAQFQTEWYCLGGGRCIGLRSICFHHDQSLELEDPAAPNWTHFRKPPQRLMGE